VASRLGRRSTTTKTTTTSKCTADVVMYRICCVYCVRAVCIRHVANSVGEELTWATLYHVKRRENFYTL
jgi:hypothetical protein